MQHAEQKRATDMRRSIADPSPTHRRPIAYNIQHAACNMHRTACLKQQQRGHAVVGQTACNHQPSESRWPCRAERCAYRRRCSKGLRSRASRRIPRDSPAAPLADVSAGEWTGRRWHMRLLRSVGIDLQANGPEAAAGLPQEAYWTHYPIRPEGALDSEAVVPTDGNNEQSLEQRQIMMQREYAHRSRSGSVPPQPIPSAAGSSRGAGAIVHRASASFERTTQVRGGAQCAS